MNRPASVALRVHVITDHWISALCPLHFALRFDETARQSLAVPQICSVIPAFALCPLLLRFQFSPSTDN